MKKFLALLLVCVVAFAVVSCDKGDPAPMPTVTTPDFAEFKTAIDQTPAASVSVKTEMTTELGVLNSNIVTIFNPDGSATVNYYIEKFNPGFEVADDKITVNKTVTLNKDGSYSDGGEFQGLLGGTVAGVKLNLDATKFVSYTVDGGVLSASVKAENTASVFGAAIAADVNFILTISNGRVVSVVLNYATSIGSVKSIISYT